MNDHIRHVFIAARDLEQHLGRVPTQTELAERLKLDPRRLEMIIKSSGFLYRWMHQLGRMMTLIWVHLLRMNIVQHLFNLSMRPCSKRK